MIEVQITACPDEEFIGTIAFHKNQVYVGFPDGDICPNIANLPPNALMIEVLPDSILVHPTQNLDFFLVNGKRATQLKHLKIGDSLNVRGAELKITQAKYENIVSKSESLEAKLLELVESDSPLLPLIETLTSKMNQL